MCELDLPLWGEDASGDEQPHQRHGDQNPGDRSDADVEDSSINANILSGRSVVRASARKSETETLSSDWMKTRNAPAKIAGIKSGSVTRRKVVNQFAPMTVDASAREGLIPLGNDGGCTIHQRTEDHDMACDRQPKRRPQTNEVGNDQCRQSIDKAGQDKRCQKKWLDRADGPSLHSRHTDGGGNGEQQRAEDCEASDLQRVPGSKLFGRRADGIEQRLVPAERKPLWGYFKVWPDVKDIIRAMTIGAIR